MLDGTYGYLWGTSMATPHVAGLGALLHARYPDYTPDQLSSAILDNAVDLGTAGWDEQYGCGRIDAYRSLAVGAHGPDPLCLPSTAWAAASAEATSPFEPPFVVGEVLVQLKADADPTSVLASYQTSAPALPGQRVLRLRVPVGKEHAAVSRLRLDPSVLHVNLNYLVFAQ
jgi:subtilisin family serine protease